MARQNRSKSCTRPAVKLCDDYNCRTGWEFCNKCDPDKKEEAVANVPTLDDNILKAKRDFWTSPREDTHCNEFHTYVHPHLQFRQIIETKGGFISRYELKFLTPCPDFTAHTDFYKLGYTSNGFFQYSTGLDFPGVQGITDKCPSLCLQFFKDQIGKTSSSLLTPVDACSSKKWHPQGPGVFASFRGYGRYHSVHSRVKLNLSYRATFKSISTTIQAPAFQYLDRIKTEQKYLVPFTPQIDINIKVTCFNDKVFGIKLTLVDATKETPRKTRPIKSNEIPAEIRTKAPSRVEFIPDLESSDSDSDWETVNEENEPLYPTRRVRSTLEKDANYLFTLGDTVGVIQVFADDIIVFLDNKNIIHQPHKIKIPHTEVPLTPHGNPSFEIGGFKVFTPVPLNGVDLSLIRINTFTTNKQKEELFTVFQQPLVSKIQINNKLRELFTNRFPSTSNHQTSPIVTLPSRKIISPEDCVKAIGTLDQVSEHQPLVNCLHFLRTGKHLATRFDLHVQNPSKKAASK